MVGWQNPKVTDGPGSTGVPLREVVEVVSEAGAAQAIIEVPPWEVLEVMSVLAALEVL